MTNLEIATPLAVREVTTVEEQVTPAKPTPIAALTGLRFVAAVLVYLTHLEGFSSAPKMLPQWLNNFMAAGFVGVALFFVLSGFVITYNYGAILAKPNLPALKDFFLARFARIYPMYFLALLFVLSNYNIAEQIRVNGSLVFEHFLMLQVWRFKSAEGLAYNTPGWSIGVEMFFYLIFPLLAWLILPRLRHTWQLIAVAILACLTNTVLAAYFSHTEFFEKKTAFNLGNYWLSRNPLGLLADFVLGCVAALLYLKWQTRPVSKVENRWGTAVLVATLVIVVYIMAVGRTYFNITYGYNALYIPFFTIIVFCLARYRNWISRILSTRAMILLGEASFAFYLIHYFILNQNVQNLSRVGSNTIYLQGLMVFGFIVCTSLGAYTFIEKPARRFIRRLGGSSAKVSNS